MSLSLKGISLHRKPFSNPLSRFKEKLKIKPFSLKNIWEVTLSVSAERDVSVGKTNVQSKKIILASSSKMSTYYNLYNVFLLSSKNCGDVPFFQICLCTYPHFSGMFGHVPLNRPT